MITTTIYRALLLPVYSPMQQKYKSVKGKVCSLIDLDKQKLVFKSVVVSFLINSLSLISLAFKFSEFVVKILQAKCLEYLTLFATRKHFFQSIKVPAKVLKVYFPSTYSYPMSNLNIGN